MKIIREMRATTGSWEVVRERKRRRVGASVDELSCTAYPVEATLVGAICAATVTELACADDASQVPADGAAIPVRASAREAVIVRRRRVAIRGTPTMLVVGR
jgi:hypothetical protein